MINNRRGSSVNVKIVSLVRKGVPSRPGMGGAVGRPPVAITARPNRSVCWFTTIVRASPKRPSPKNTSTPAGAVAPPRRAPRSRRGAPASAAHHSREVHSARPTVTPSAAARRTSPTARAGSEEGFRRHAAGVQAITTEQVTLDEGHSSTETDSPHRADQPGGAATEYHEVVGCRRRRIGPLRGPHATQQRQLCCICRHGITLIEALHGCHSESGLARPGPMSRSPDSAEPVEGTRPRSPGFRLTADEKLVSPAGHRPLPSYSSF